VPDFGDDRPTDATDFNDMAIRIGSDAVERAIARATASHANQVMSKSEGADNGRSPSVRLLRGSEIKPEPVAWLWDGWLARGKMHVLGGAPGTGKTTIAMALAATVSTGGRWPDDTRVAAGNVVIWSGEDDPADTLAPRLIRSGADMNRVYFIADVTEESGSRSFDPARDIETLRRRLAEIGGAKMLIVDPIVSAIAGDSHKNAEVRRGLQPLADLAASEDCAVLGITHLSKGTGGREPVERLTGSVAFGALARLVFVAAKHQEERDDGRTTRLFLRAKSNIGPDNGGFEYDLDHGELRDHPGNFGTCVLWRGPVQGAARELLALAEANGDEGEEGALADAKHFLMDALANGPVATKAIKADANGAGLSWPTVRRAQKALGIRPFKRGMKDGWYWRMPDQDEMPPSEDSKMLKHSEDVQQEEVSTFGQVEHLRYKSGVVEVEI
jgi:putative DNA primase/helicase